MTSLTFAINLKKAATRSISALILVSAATLIHTAAFASTVTNRMSVSATVLAICTVSTNSPALGTMNNLTVNCTVSTPYTVAFSNGTDKTPSLDAELPARQALSPGTNKNTVTVTLTY